MGLGGAVGVREEEEDGSGYDGQSNEKAPLEEKSRASFTIDCIVFRAIEGYASYSSSVTVFPARQTKHSAITCV